MSLEENKAILCHALDEIWNKGNLAAADELASANFAAETNMPGLAANADVSQMKRLVAMYRTAFPDLHMTFDDMIAESDRVAVRFTATGTHLGQMLNIPPTGKQVSVSNITVYRMRDGQIVEQWGLTDTLGLLRQLGVTSPLGPAS